MRRAIAVAVALAALAAMPASAPGAVCPVPVRLVFHATPYKPVATRATVPLGRRLGTGTIVTCRTTNVPPGVAVALRGRTRRSLYVSRATPTAAERAVLARLRGG